jgi:hypothetical protein
VDREFTFRSSYQKGNALHQELLRKKNDTVRVDGFCSDKPVIIGGHVDDSKAVEPEFLTGRPRNNPLP